MSTFDRREDAFEKKFVRDEELHFKAEARRDKLAAAWAAQKIGLSGAALDKYVNDILALELSAPGGDKVAQKLLTDLAKAGVSLSEHQVRRTLDEFFQEAMAQVRKEG